MADLAHLLESGRSQHASGDLESAAATFREALQLAPGQLEPRYYLAWVEFERGNASGGIEGMRGLIADFPAEAMLHNELGMMLARTGALEQAVASFQTGIRQNAQGRQAHFNLGNALRQLGRYEQAGGAYRAALAIAPVPEVYLNLGVVEREQGRFDAARAAFEEAVRLRPAYAEAWTNLGVVHKASRDFEKAAECHRRAIKINPNHAPAYSNLGTALRAQKQLGPAVEAFQAALRLKPDYWRARLNLIDALATAGNLEQARAVYREGETYGTSDAVAIRTALLLPVIAESSEQIEDRRAEIERDLEALSKRPLEVDEPDQTIGIPCFLLAYHGRNDVRLQRTIAETLRQATPSLAYVAPHCSNPRLRGGRRIRLGFISDSLRDHTIGKLNRGLIERLDRQQFEIVICRTGRPVDGTTQQILQAADRAVTLAPQLAQARQQIAEQELDIAFYPDIGMDPLTYYLAHARLAPVQITTWGHPLTTGIPTVDYFISSRDLETPEAEAHYTERLVRLDRLANYYYRPDPPSAKSRAEFGLSEIARLYTIPQSLFKMYPDEDAVWGEILARDPQAQLVLLEGEFAEWTERLRDRFRRTIPGAVDRMVFLPRQSSADFSRLLEVSDVVLDPHHFGGGDTSYQAFAVGTPVLTLPGPFLRSRITYALYRTMGVDDAIATSCEDYIVRALRLANDPGHRSSVREKILAGHPAIFENESGCRELEAFLLQVGGQG